MEEKVQNIQGKGKTVYKYQDVNERLKTMNRFVVLGSSVLLLVFAIYLAAKKMNNNIAAPTAYGNLILIALLWVSILVVYLKNPASDKFRRLPYIGFAVEYLLLAVQTDTEFINVALLGLIISCIPYYDRRFFKKVSGFYAALYILCIVVRAIKGQSANDVNFVCMLLIMLLLFYTATRIGTISKRFNDDALGAISEQSKEQKRMMDDILHVSQDIYVQTDKSGGVLQNLYDSSESVNRSMREISSAAGVTADNIQEQNTMTQEIQHSIDEVAEYSGRIVHIASESNEDIRTDIQFMQELKQQSVSMADTNTVVTRSMEKLQQKTREVQEIAGMIFKISFQTNMLALNASIESARAGAAGKGFAVVAEQIRDLAYQTRVSTESITGILQELDRNAQEVVTSVEISMEAAGRQNNTIVQTAENFEKLSSNMSLLLTEIKDVDGKISSLADTNNRIVDNISQLSATTQEVTANAEEASTLSTQNLENAKQARESLQIIRRDTEELEKYI